MKTFEMHEEYMEFRKKFGPHKITTPKFSYFAFREDEKSNPPHDIALTPTYTMPTFTPMLT
jgi:hypothetical protein